MSTDYGPMMAISQILFGQYHIWNRLGFGLKSKIICGKKQLNEGTPINDVWFQNDPKNRTLEGKNWTILGRKGRSRRAKKTGHHLWMFTDGNHGQGTHNAKKGADSSAINTPKFIRRICLIDPKYWDIVEKRLRCASVVRGNVWDGLLHGKHLFFLPIPSQIRT